MCDVCAELQINTYLAVKWAKQYEEREHRLPGFLQSQVATDEVDGVLTDVYYGNPGHAFYAAAGVKRYQDLVNKLKELSVPFDH
jgi:hypothetical protein